MAWENAGGEFVPFLYYDAEFRHVICSPNAIQRAGRHEAPLPRRPSLDLTGTGANRWMSDSKPALNAFAGRLFPIDR
jgi:hypothetical protein